MKIKILEKYNSPKGREHDIAYLVSFHFLSKEILLIVSKDDELKEYYILFEKGQIADIHPEFISKEISDYEKIQVYRFIRENLVHILCQAIQKGLLEYDEVLKEIENNPLLADIYALMKMWGRQSGKRQMWKNFPSLWIEIEEIPFSFSSILRILLDAEIIKEWKISKTGRYLIYPSSWEDIFIVEGKKRGESFQLLLQFFPEMRKIVWYFVGERIVIGGEWFNGIIHREIAFPKDEFERLRFYLLYRRLGDLIFISEKEEIPSSYIHPASSSSIQKIQILKGEIREKEGNLIFLGGALIHPEHGLLSLPMEEYRIFRFPSHD